MRENIVSLPQELEEVVNDERRWARALYNLRHTLWPDGRLYVSQSVQRTQKEREKLMEDAAAAIKQFLPSMCAQLAATNHLLMQVQ